MTLWAKPMSSNGSKSDGLDLGEGSACCRQAYCLLGPGQLWGRAWVQLYLGHLLSTAFLASPASSSHCVPAANFSSYGPMGGDHGSCSLLTASDQMDLLSVVEQMGLMESPLSSMSGPLWEPGFVTVFINGVASDVPNGPLDIRARFGPDAVLFNWSGDPVAVNDFVVSLESLLTGERDFRVSRSIHTTAKPIASAPKFWT